MNKISSLLVEVKFSEPFLQIKYVKLERRDALWMRETVNLSITKPKRSLVFDVSDSENETILIILELNNEESSLVYCSKDTMQEKEDDEMKQQLDTLKNLFGGENELSITESSIEETDAVFNNFGKGLSTMFSLGHTNQPQPQPEIKILNKNEKSQLTWEIKKK